MRFGNAPPPAGRSGRQPLEAVTRQAPLAPVQKPASTPGEAPARHSRRPRVLFVGEAISLTHARRPFALARGINPALFEVVFACDVRFRHLFPPVDFETVPLRSIPSEQFLDALAAGSPIYDAGTLEEYVEEDERLFREVSPDIVVGDFRLSLGVSARVAGIPYVCLAESCWSPYAKLKIPLAEHPGVKLVGPRAAQAIFKPIRAIAFAYHALPMNAVRRHHGLRGLRLDLRRVFTDGDYALYVDIPELTPMYELPANHQYLGPVLWSPEVPLPAWWSEMPRHLPIVFVALGSVTSPAILPIVLEALEPLPVTIIAETRGARLPHVPKNAFVADFLPRELMIKEARLVICSGSTSSSHQALAQGRPVLGIVSNMNQHLNMQAVEQAKAGRFTRAGTIESRALGDLALSFLARPSYTEAAQGLARTLARYDAATRLQDLLSRIPVHTTSAVL
jgi:UDP:flavonoid glycosyltransferase YjiC (YdhE family)